jgi:hypothetical protein
MNRRNLLRGATGSAVLGLAGCQEVLDRVRNTDPRSPNAGSKTDVPTEPPTPQGPPSLAGTQLTVAGDATAGTETRLLVRAENVGGGGSVSGTIRSVDGPTAVSTEFEQAEIAPGAEFSTEVSLTLTRAGTYTLEVTGTRFEEAKRIQVPVGTQVAAPGSTLQLGTGLEMTVEGFRYRNLITYTADLGLGYSEPAVTGLSPSPERVLGIVQLSFRSRRTDDIWLGPLGWTMPNGNLLEKYPKTNESGYRPRGVRTTQHATGESLFYATLKSDEQERKVFAPFSIDRAQASKEIRFGLQRDGPDTDSPIDVVCRLDTPGVPELELEAFGVGDSPLEGGVTSRYPVKVANTGTAPLDLQLALQRKPSTKRNYPMPLETTFFHRGLAPGAATTWSVTDKHSALGPYDIRILGLGQAAGERTKRVTYRPARVSLGDPVDFEIGSMQVEAIVLKRDYEAAEQALGGTRAPDGKQYCFIFVTLDAGREIDSIPDDGFLVAYPDQWQYRGESRMLKPSSDDPDLDPPERFDTTTSLSEGDTEQGWLKVLVPERLGRSDVTAGFQGVLGNRLRGGLWEVS